MSQGRPQKYLSGGPKKKKNLRKKYKKFYILQAVCTNVTLL